MVFLHIESINILTEGSKTFDESSIGKPTCLAQITFGEIFTTLLLPVE